jgi:hypothetical protein
MRQKPLSTILAATLVTWSLGVALSFSAACAREAGRENMPSQDAAASLGTAAAVRIDQPAVAVPLKTGPAAGRLRQAVRSAGQVRLTLDGITVSRPPGVLFNIYLATAGPHPQRQYVGTLSFFGVEGTGKVSLPARSFDVSAPLRALLGTGDPPPELQVVFEATDGTADSTVAKAAPSFNRDAGLRVGAVRLQLQ